MAYGKGRRRGRKTSMRRRGRKGGKRRLSSRYKMSRGGIRL